jgi:hypothetical protein
MVVKEWEDGIRRTLVAAVAVSVLTAIMLALPQSALALPSEKPDNTPMVDGRVRAIEQVGTNIWVGGRFTKVKKRDGTVLANVANVAVFDSQTEQYKPIAPSLGSGLSRPGARRQDDLGCVYLRRGGRSAGQGPDQARYRR